MAAIPSSPVNRAIESADDLEYQLTFVRARAGDAEGVFDEVRGFVEVLFSGVIEPAKHGPRVDLFTGLHFEDHADGGVDRIFLPGTPRPHHGRCPSNILCGDRTHIAGARRE